MAKHGVTRILPSADDLRTRAEQEAGTGDVASKKALPPEQAQEVLHELRVHQIELEMQNEELLRAQKELEASRERYFDLYNLAPVGYFTLSKQGLILEANLTAAKKLGLQRQALIQRPLTHFILFADHDIYHRHHNRLFETGAPQMFDLRLVKQDASQFWARFETTPAHGGESSPVCLAAMSDITESKRAEESLRESEEAADAANRAKDQFIAVLSHELRPPLTPVLAAVSSIQARHDLPAPLRSEVELIYRNVEMEAILIDDLLDVTRISRGKLKLQPEAVDVHDCLKTTLEVCQKQIGTKRLDIRLDLHATRHHVWADPVRLRQVFWNLLTNAVKFTPDGGQITLRTFAGGPGVLKIEVADNGIGIDPEVMPQLFHPFKQGGQGKIREFGGLGLGLSIAKAVVELHQGRVSAFSEGRNKGATFTVELDTISPPRKPSPPPPEVEHEERSLRILLVEDHADTLHVFVNLLKNWKHSVATAESVQEARRLAATSKFDLLISDLGLPDGSGLDLMREIKKQCGIPGIAFSGYGTEEDIRESQAAGFASHLVKPVNAEALRAAIGQFSRSLHNQG